VTAPIAPLGTTQNFGTGGPVTVANYTVVAGDTLASIATRYGTTIEKLMQANSITNANRIFTGQKLVIVR
jgi:LysM repeat protein